MSGEHFWLLLNLKALFGEQSESLSLCAYNNS